jgi:hypothetical protein
MNAVAMWEVAPRAGAGVAGRLTWGATDWPERLAWVAGG